MAEQQGRRTQAERRALAETRVIEAAIDWIADRGSSSLTLAGVGEAAGYSRGIVSHHFGSREALLRRVIEQTRRFDPVPQQHDGLARLTKTVAAYLEHIGSSKPAGRAFLRMWSEAIARDPALEPLFAEQDASFRALIAELIDAGIDDGSIASDVDARAGAVFVAACLRGTGMQLIATPPVGPLKAIVTASVRLVERAFSPVQ